MHFLHRTSMGIYLLLITLIIISGCNQSNDIKGAAGTTQAPSPALSGVPAASLAPSPVPTSANTPTSTPASAPTSSVVPSPALTPTKAPAPVITQVPVTPSVNVQKASQTLVGKKLCIDPGHQEKGNNATEAIAPGSTTVKPKVTSGTQGVATKLPEYKLTLDISLRLRDELAARGAEVIMTRNVHAINISNVERAQLANDNQVDLAVRVHADGSDDSTRKGISMHYPSGYYVKDKQILASSKTAASMMLNAVIRTTGAKNLGLFERDDLTGFNWTKVPAILIEMGFMTNPGEDRLLSDANYREKIVQGMVAGIEDYFK